MTNESFILLSIVMLEFFIMGLWIGGAMAARENPNEPKPKNWDNKLHEEWNKGYRAGEKSTITRMSSKLKDAELLEEYNSKFRKGE